MAASSITYEPLPRDNHAAVAVGSKLHVWGGWAGWKEKSQEFSKTIEVFDITTELWEQIPTHGTQPPGLWNTAYTVVGMSLYIFGGWDGVSCHNSLYKLDLCIFQWEKVKITDPSAGPQRKFGSGMVSYRDNKLIVFAGFTDSGTTDELHVLNLDNGEWSSPTMTGTKPPPVFAFSFTKIDSKRAVAYGGCESRGTSGDAYVFELDKWHWHKLETTGRLSPCARFSHAACSIGFQQEHPLLLVKGGCIRLIDQLNNVLMEVLNDMWVLDVDKAIWSKVILPQEMGPRYQHTADVVDSRLNFRMVIMCGGTKKFLGDPVAETNLLYLERLGSSWEVTRVVTMEDLKRPVGRLREQLAIFEKNVRRLEAEKQAADTRAENAERRIADLQQTVAFRTLESATLRSRAEDAEREVRRLEKEKLADEAKTKRRIADLQTRAEEAERRTADAEKTATVLIRHTADTNQRVRDAEARAQGLQRMVTQAEERSTHAEHRATQAEIEVHFVRQQLDNMALRVREAEQTMQEAEQTTREAQERARTTEQRIQRLEARSHDQFWRVHRDEIQFTDQELGRGGWAVVKVAKFRGLQVAAKCLHTLIVSDYNRQLFLREMSIAARVRHPNLVQFIGATVEGELVILTELMATSLRVVLERRPLNPAQINSMSLDVARALNYLHHMHPDPILHRDISSSNVLLEPGPSHSWRAKVSDYGSANFLQQLRTAGPGNPVYAAPEADFPSQQSPKMDVYSYGVLLLEMCSRRFPSREEFDALLQRVQQPTMVALIQQCLEQEPSQRPTMSDLIGQLSDDTVY